MLTIEQNEYTVLTVQSKTTTWSICVRVSDAHAAAECRESCNNHGECINRRCHCFPGYAGPTCADSQYSLSIAAAFIPRSCKICFYFNFDHLYYLSHYYNIDVTVYIEQIIYSVFLNPQYSIPGGKILKSGVHLVVKVLCKYFNSKF